MCVRSSGFCIIGLKEAITLCHVEESRVEYDSIGHYVLPEVFTLWMAEQPQWPVASCSPADPGAIPWCYVLHYLATEVST